MKPLFNQASVFNVMEYQKQELKKEFQRVSDKEIDADPEGAASRLVEQFGFYVPVLDDENKYALTKQAEVDVSHDPRRFIRDRSTPFYISGTEVTIVVPFRGDAGLFGVQPTSFTLNPPHAEIHNGELHLVYRVT